MIIKILTTIAFYLILMFLSTNLLGLFIRSLFMYSEFDRLKQADYESIKREAEKSENIIKRINIIGLVLVIIYLYLLFHFWNLGVVTAAIIIMIGRLPDLLWEIKHDKKIKKIDLQLMKKDILYYSASTLPWLALIVLYFSL